MGTEESRKNGGQTSRIALLLRKTEQNKPRQNNPFEILIFTSPQCKNLPNMSQGLGEARQAGSHWSHAAVPVPLDVRAVI